MSVLHLLSFTCEGERRAKHFIFNLASLYPTFRESRHRTFKKESHNERSRSMAREAVVRRHSFAQQVIRFHVIVFVCVCSSFVFKARRMDARETKSVRDTQCANPNVLSKISLDREKKEERILSADDDIFYALLNSLFRTLFFPLLWFVLLLRLKTGRRELDGGRCERWRGLLAR